MTIISNDCTAGFIYNEPHQKFQTPFIWTGLDLDNFIKLIENYDKINFNNISLKYVINKTGISFQNKTYPIMTIDNLVEVHFRHHFYNKDKDIDFNTKDRYVEGKNIDEYVREKYFNRIKRMDENPIFIWNEKLEKFYNSQNIDNLNNINKNYKICFYSREEKSFTNKNIQYIHRNEQNLHLIEKPARELAHILLDKKLIA